MVAIRRVISVSKQKPIFEQAIRTVISGVRGISRSNPKPLRSTDTTAEQPPKPLLGGTAVHTIQLLESLYARLEARGIGGIPGILYKPKSQLLKGELYKALYRGVL